MNLLPENRILLWAVVLLMAAAFLVVMSGVRMARTLRQFTGRR